MTSESEEIGLRSEESFFRALGFRTEKTPPWFKKVFQAAPELDVRGIDGFAKLRYPEKNEWVYVPIQIKSSKGGLIDYLKFHPEAWLAGVLIFVVNQDPDEVLRSRFYDAITIIYEKRRYYDEFLRQTLSHPLTPKMARIVTKIHSRRSKRK